jgi:hypothetical protein
MHVREAKERGASVKQWRLGSSPQKCDAAVAIPKSTARLFRESGAIPHPPAPAPGQESAGSSDCLRLYAYRRACFPFTATVTRSSQLFVRGALPG